jgi:ADP-ribose pyrophosphatase YjhB (NUDIX family)
MGSACCIIIASEYRLRIVPRAIHGASACLVDEQGRVLMIAREKEPFQDRREAVPRGDAYAFPGGNIEEGENAIDAARRELFEETGYRATGEPLANVVIEFTTRGTMVRIESFAFSEWSAPDSSKTKAELDAKWMTFEQALASRLAPGMHEALETFRKVVR